MSANNGKANFAPSHGQSLADQSFESIKSKEVRDSMDPSYDIKFQSLALNNPTSSGWNVQSSHEVSPDGRAYRSDTVATTGGVESVNGGIAEYQGHNEQRSSASETGDDKNFVKKSAESTKTHLQEKVVVGDEKSGRMEMKTSSTTSASSSQVFQSSSTFESGDEKFLKDNVDYNQRQKSFENDKLRHLQQQQHDLRQQQQNYEQQLHNEYITKQHETQKSQSIREQETTEKTRRVVELDKNSPEYQQHVQYLMQQPGEVISNTVEYPQPNVKMITTVKRLPDGTIVRNKRYETEATAEEAAQYRQTQSNTSTTKQTTTKRDNTREDTKQSARNYQNIDDVDNVRVANENVTQSFKTVKESTQRHVTKSSSETVEEHSTAKNTDFSTHGFPSVRDDKPTQEFPTDHPHSLRSTSFPTKENFPKGSNVMNTVDSDDVFKVSKQVHQTMKQKTSGEHIMETEVVGDDISTHGYPSVRDEKLTQQFYSDRPSNYDDTNSRNAQLRMDHNPQTTTTTKCSDYSTHGYPSARSPTKTPNSFEYTKVPTTTTTKTTTTKVTSKPPSAPPTTKFIQKERETDASHRAFAASLRSESPVDHANQHRQSPRSSISSHKTFRREDRAGSHDSGSSRFSSGTVTRQSPSKSVGKTVVTKNTNVKSRNVNGSNETIDLTSQRSTKSPSPMKGQTSSTTTTTTRTILTTKTKPDDVPKPDNPIQINKIAEHSSSTINEPLTKTKSHFSTNATKFSDIVAIEEPCIKKNYYKLGQNTDQIADELMAKQTTKLKPETADIKELVSTMLETFKQQPTAAEQTQKTSTTSNNIVHKPINNTNHTEKLNVIEKSLHSPAQSSNRIRTHPQNQNAVPISELRRQSSNKPINQMKTATSERRTVERNVKAKNDKSDITHNLTDIKTNKIKDETNNSQTFKKDILVKARISDDTVIVTESHKKEGSPQRNMPMTKDKSQARDVNNIFISVEANKPLKDDKVNQNKTNKDYNFVENEKIAYEMEKSKTLNRHSTPAKMNSPTPQSPTKSKVNEFPFKKQPEEYAPIKTMQPTKSLDHSVDDSEETFVSETTTTFSRQSTPIKVNSPAPQSPTKNKLNEFPFNKQPSNNSPIKRKEPKESLDHSVDDSEETFQSETTTTFSRQSTPIKKNGPAPQSPTKSKVNEFPLKKQPSDNSPRASSPLKTREPKRSFDHSVEDSEDTFKSTTTFSRHSTPMKMNSPAPQSPTKNKVNEFPFKKQPSDNSPRASSPVKTKEPKKSVDHSVEDSEETFKSTTTFARQSIPMKMNNAAPQSPSKTKENEFHFKKQVSENSPRASSPQKTTEPKKPLEDNSFEQAEETYESKTTTSFSRQSPPMKMNSTAPQTPTKTKVNEFPFKRQPAENTNRASSPLKIVIDKFETQRKLDKSDTDGMIQTKFHKEDFLIKETIDKQKRISEKDIDLKQKVSLKDRNTNETEINEFIRNEQSSAFLETADGSLISKEPKEPETPSSPTYRKKGTGPRETFEDRCRKILGMEEDGATLGQYKVKKSVEDLLENESAPKFFEVTIEDCEDDDDDDSYEKIKVKQSNKKETTTLERKSTKNVELERTVKSSPLKKQPEITPTKGSVRKNNKARDIEEVSIKNRLRSATKSSKDDIDANSSPEISPDRLTERRRSSNISVHTEIIIDHAGPKSASPEKEIPEFTKDMKKTTVKKSTVTDRRDSGTPTPTPSRLTRRDKERTPREDSPKHDVHGLKPDRRPNKCFSTKTINLSTNEITNKQVESDQIIIDIQHAKSSREPSPDKIVPIPVPDHVDVGSPRYPDVVQEPEDYPKPKPVVTNIPILEEETNEYVGCQITEVSIDRMSEISDEILANPTVEAPQSLEYASINKPDDDCLLTVVEKVSKFTKAADELETTKNKKTFVREFDVSNKVAQDDECLLTVDQKVSKFLKTAEEVTKPLTPVRELPKPNFENYNEELQHDDCTLSVSQKVEKFLTTSDKMKATAPQKSPELVARMERQISTQTNDDTTDSEEEDVLTEEEVEHHIVRKQSAVEKKSEANVNITHQYDDESVYPMSKGHTTAIELKRQKDILSRPSVFDKKSPTKTAPAPVPVSTLNKRTSLTKIENVEKKNIRNSLNIKINHKNETTKSDLTHSPTTPVGTKPNVTNLTEHSGTGNQIPKSNEISIESKKTKATITNLSGRTKEASDSVAARRSLFEKSAPQSPVQSPRRPSYMDHTKSSLEHTRRDSLEINKSSYKRKISTDEESYGEHRPNTAVKFDVPHRTTKIKVQEDEDMNIEEIFDLEFLEELLEKVTSYELRRRIRAQIRVVKKMMVDSSSVETSHISSSTTYSSKKHHEETDAFSDVGHTGSLKSSVDHIREESLHGEKVNEKPENLSYKPRDRSHSPLGKTISSSLKEVRRDSDTKSSIRQHYKIESHMESSSSQYSHKEDRQSRERSISPELKKQTTQPKQSVSPKRSSISSQKGAERKQESFSMKSTEKVEEQLPIWTERKNILKSPSKDVKSKKITESRISSNKTTQSTAERQRKPADEDCVISSYGIGPTDENGLPLFGIRALKTKKFLPADDMDQKITGYVVEEKYYSENQGTPKTERKEYIYSTDAGELKQLEKQMKSERMTTDSESKSIQSKKDSSSLREDDLMKSFKKMERRGSVKEMSEKFVRKESSQSITEKQNKYPKAGLILRTRSRSGSHDENIKNKVESKVLTESESETETIKIRRDSNQKTSTKSTRSFLNSTAEERKVTGIDDVLERMRNADNVTETGDSQEDQEARSLLNKFFGASAIMSCVEAAMPMTQTKKTKKFIYSNNDGSPLEEVKTTQITTKTIKSNTSTSKPTTCFIEEIEDELLLRDLLEKSTTYEERRKIRARLRELMAEREGEQKTAKAAASTAQVEDAESSGSEYEEIIEEVTDYSEEEEEAEAEGKKLEKSAPTKVEKVCDKKPPIKEDKTKTIETAAVKSETVDEKDTLTETEKAEKPTAQTKTTEKTESKEKDGSVVTTTTKVTTRTVTKPESPFNKFRQLDKQNSLQSTKSTPTTPTTPGGGTSTDSPSGSGVIFKFTDPALNARAATAKEQLLQWCQNKTQEYENIQITNFSSSWNDGLAFCALIHHFLPDAFDYTQLTAKNRRHNFQLAFNVADEKAGIAPLLDVDDMVMMKRPDWKCVFVYVQSIYRRFRNCQ